MLPTHILVPTDFSDHADKAIDFAIALAKTVSAQVTLAHFSPLPALVMQESTMAQATQWMERLVADSNAALQRTAEQRRASGVALRCFVREVDPRTGILEAVASERCDLVVMGTHGRRGLERALLGSVAEEIVRHCTCPVLTVRI